MNRFLIIYKIKKYCKSHPKDSSESSDVSIGISFIDSTAHGGDGLDFGTFCDNSPATSEMIGFDIQDTAGVSLPLVTGIGGENGTSTGNPITTACTSPTTVFLYHGNNVVREPKFPNTSVGPIGQIGLSDTNLWPIVQLFNLNPTGNVVVQYNKGGGVQSTTLTFDTVDQFADAELDRAVYAPGSQVHVTVIDPWLNIDPTDEDSWTFGALGGSASTNYQVFDENGARAGDANATAGVIDISNSIGDMMCEDNCVLLLDVDVQGTGAVITIQDNDDSQIVLNSDGSADVATDFATAGNALNGTIPLTITEQGPNSGVFGTSDESDKSVLKVLEGAERGTSAIFDYNEHPISVLVGYSSGSIDIQPIDDEWDSGEEIPVILIDNDANKNSRADEDLDLNNPSISMIPSLRTGSPITLSGLTEVEIIGQIENATAVPSDVTSNVKPFSDIAILTVEEPIEFSTISPTVRLTFGTMENLFESTPIDDSSFRGVVLFNYDIRSLHNQGNLESISSVDIVLSGTSIGTDQDLQGLILLDASEFSGKPATDALEVTFTLNGVSSDRLEAGTKLPVVADIFGFGFLNNGLDSSERFSNQIIRIEVEETGDNTGAFEGSLEYVMVNQLNVLDVNTYLNLSTIADEPMFVVFESLTDENSPRVDYIDLASDGLPRNVSDQEDAPSHTGIVSFDRMNYEVGDTAVVTLEDMDLNVDSDLLEIYTLVSVPFANDTAFGSIGEPNLPSLSFGPLGKMLDVTLDEVQWKSPQGTCNTLVSSSNAGLDETNFSLVETGTRSGVFVGDFRVPGDWCRTDDGQPEPSLGLGMSINYVDFRDGSSQITQTSDAAIIVENADLVPPAITSVENITIFTSDPNGAIVSYQLPTVTDDVDPNPTIECTPSSGGQFTLGTTVISCVASDSNGNTATTTFNVMVVDDSTTLGIENRLSLLEDKTDSLEAKADSLEITVAQMFSFVTEQFSGLFGVFPTVQSDVEELKAEIELLKGRISELESP